MLKDKSFVRVLEGCIMGMEDVAGVAKEIKQGRWSLGVRDKEAK